MTPPPAPSSLNPRLSPTIDAVLLRALSKEADGRFPSVIAFSRAFLEAVQRDGELHAILAISRAEAQTGTTRRLTLPGERQISVTVPAGVSDGATLRLEEQGMPAFEGGPAHQPSFSTGESRASTAAKTHASRRIVLVGLVGLIAVALASRIAWLTLSHTSPTEGIHASPSGVITEFPIPTPQTNLDGITAGPDGNLWFTEKYGNKIGRITRTGTVTEFPISTSYSGLSGITAGPDGNLWFAEYNGNQIGRITRSGTVTEFPVPTFNSGPGEITTGPDHNLWFTEQNGNQIGRITSGK